MTILSSRTISTSPPTGNPTAAKIMALLIQLSMIGTLLRPSLLSSANFRLSRRTLGRAVAEARPLGVLDGQDPGGDPFVESLELPSTRFITNLTYPAQEELGARARQLAGRVADALRRAEADAATGYGMPWHLLVAIPVIVVFEYFVGVTISESVYNLDSRSSHVLAVALAVLSIAAGAIWVVSMDEATMRRHGRWVRRALPVIVVVFVGSSAIVLARGTVTLGDSVVTGGSNTDQVASPSAMDRLLTSAGHLVYPSAILMAILTVVLLEIALELRHFNRRRPESSRTVRLEHKVRSLRARGAAQLEGITQASKALEGAGIQIQAAWWAGVLQSLPAEFLDRVMLHEPLVYVPAWRAETERLARQLRSEDPHRYPGSPTL